MNKLFIKTALTLGMMVLIVTPVGAAGAADRDISETVIQNHNADASVLPAMIVGYKGKDRPIVVPLSVKNIRDMLGVLIPVSYATFTLTSQTKSPHQVLVATSGDYPVLVSNQSGFIKS